MDRSFRLGGMRGQDWIITVFRTVIGVSAYAEDARWAVWDLPATVVPQRYLDKIVAAGGVPVVLPAVADVRDALPRLDGLMLIGGGDVDPVLYGAVPHAETGRICPDRDTAELALLRGALSLGLPVLGICRGLQLLNVALGGTLHQHVPDLVGHGGHAGAAGGFARHSVRLRPDGGLAEALGRTALDVPSYHHQAIDRPGAGLRPVAWSDDGLIEAAELAGHPFAVGVQWHPEADEDDALFAAFVAAAASPGRLDVHPAAPRC